MNSTPSPKPSIIVIGAGPMGLAAAYQAAKRGFDVDLIETSDRVGGMAAHFDFDGLSIERFYHFCCLSDDATLELLDELGMSDAMKWVPTTMGYFIDGALHKWGEPFALLSFPKLSLLEKIRYGLHAAVSVARPYSRRLDKVSAEDWFIAWCGRSVYDRMWRRLLELKFYELTDTISAAWIWQRMKRVGKSRASLFEERLGYIEGGSAALMDALQAAIERLGGRVHLSTRAKRIVIKDGRVTGVETDRGVFAADQVISTIPTPYVSDLLSGAGEALSAPYKAIKNIGVVCVMFKLKRPVTGHFWVNIVDEKLGIPGIIEYSNLRPLDHSVVYVPYYMPQSNPRFADTDEGFLSEAFECLQKINPSLDQSDILATHVGRLQYAQPICQVGFSAMLPPVQTPIAGLQIADTCFYYPEDRGVSESAKLAKSMVEHASAASMAP